MLAPYATKAENSKGRLFKENLHKNRNCFQHDRDRIIHSQAFRRLEYKTQVFVNHEGDHFRTRLTHTLEVAQLARTLARRLSLNCDLTEVFALAHDLGHPPFGHAGERALNKMMQEFGGFDHNVNSFKIVTKLEQRYAEFDGLNLTFESLAGLVKHNGPLTNLNSAQKYIADFDAKFSLDLNKYPSLEAQIGALADDIAYNNHDIDDGFRAGLLAVEDFSHINLVEKSFNKVMNKYPHIEKFRILNEVLRAVYTEMVDDLIMTTEENMQKAQITSAEDVINSQNMIADFSPKMKEEIGKIRALLMKKIYLCPKINQMTYKAESIITDLFTYFMGHPECLDTKFQNKLQGQAREKQAEIICDYIAGMTDRFAMRKHKEIFDLHAESRYF